MENRNRNRATGSAGSDTGGSAGTRGRAGRDQDQNAYVADTSPGDVRTGGQASEGALGGPHTGYTAAERGTAGLAEIPGMERFGSRAGYGRGPRGDEEYGMEQMSRMIREEREEGDPGMQEQMQRRSQRGKGPARTETRTGDVAWIMYVQECAICDREHGIANRERGMADRERAMYDRECMMSDRERSPAYCESERQSPTGSMTSEQSRRGRGSASSQAGMNR